LRQPEDISFKVSQGEQISIMGANGSGKSTLLALLDGLIFPTMGEFHAFDNMVSEEIFDTIKDNEFLCNYSAYQNMSIDVDSDENVENNK
jgi:ABC-type polysaccharide/polyol phosphate transport system ATPase subunit